MRKQYHFRESPRGLLSWDVHRLVELTRNSPRFRIPIGDVKELDETYWFNGKRDVATCRKVVEHVRLVNEADPQVPIILGTDGRVMDGMHRVCKALLLGHTSIMAVRFLVDPEPDFVGVKPEKLPY